MTTQQFEEVPVKHMKYHTWILEMSAFLVSSWKLAQRLVTHYPHPAVIVSLNLKTKVSQHMEQDSRPVQKRTQCRRETTGSVSTDARCCGCKVPSSCQNDWMYLTAAASSDIWMCRIVCKNHRRTVAAQSYSLPLLRQTRMWARELLTEDPLRGRLHYLHLPTE